MAKSKVGIMGITVLAILGAAGLTHAEPAKLGQVVYITRSKACGCSAQTVKLVDKVVSQVFSGPRQALLKRIDYDTDRQAAVPYIGEFRLLQLPALLLLDSQGRLLWSAIGSVAVAESFLLKLLSLSGFHPSLLACAECGRPDPELFSSGQSGAVCSACAGPDAGPASRQALGFLATLGSTGLTEAGDLSTDPRTLREARALLFGFAEYHLERRMKSLPMLARSLAP